MDKTCDPPHRLVETATDFHKKVGTMLSGSFVTLGIALGSRLRLFDLMAKFEEPKTSHQIAEAAGYKERYVREWLGIMCTAHIVELDESGKRYWLPAHRHEVLTDPGQLAVLSWALPIAAGAEQDVVGCFQKEGPNGIPYSRYPLFHEWVDRGSHAHASWPALKEKLKFIPGLLDQLECGIQVCEMGTSTGRVVLTLAERFSKSTIWGLDCSDEAISIATRLAKEKMLTNVKFQVQDVCAMPSTWANKWDCVILFDVAHDVPCTSTLMQELMRTLKPGGHLLLVDINMHTDHQDNIDDPNAPMMYCISLFHCMPVSLHMPGGEGMGAAWGREKACEMLQEAGLSAVKVVVAQGTDMTITCHKPNEAD